MASSQTSASSVECFDCRAFYFPSQVILAPRFLLVVGLTWLLHINFVSLRSFLKNSKLGGHVTVLKRAVLLLFLLTLLQMKHFSKVLYTIYGSEINPGSSLACTLKQMNGFMLPHFVPLNYHLFPPSSPSWNSCCFKVRLTLWFGVLQREFFLSAFMEILKCMQDVVTWAVYICFFAQSVAVSWGCLRTRYV